MILTLYLYWPYFVVKIQKFWRSHSHFGSQAFEYDGEGNLLNIHAEGLAKGMHSWHARSRINGVHSYEYKGEARFVSFGGEGKVFEYDGEGKDILKPFLRA